jgi:hypothetical protein
MPRLFLVLLVSTALFAGSLHAAMPGHQCAITSDTSDTLDDENEQVACPSLTPFQAIGTTNYDAVRSNIGPAAYPIDAWNRCRCVDNNSIVTTHPSAAA